VPTKYIKALFHSSAQDLRDLLEKEASKEKPVLSAIQDPFGGLKSQLEGCKVVQNKYLPSLNTEVPVAIE